METIESYEKRKWEMYQDQGNPKNGIECPKCGEEMVDSDRFLLLSNPPQKNIHCPKCGYKTTVIA